MHHRSMDPHQKKERIIKTRSKSELFTRMLVGIHIVEIVGLFAELHGSIAVTELLDQKSIISLHNLPDKWSRNRSHFYCKD